MSAVAPFVARWAVLGPGHIAERFVAALQVDGAKRDAADIQHRISAIGSRDLGRAQAFATEHVGRTHSPRCHGSYAALLADKESFDIVYVATPPAMHFANVRDSLLAGKHVLVEKPATINAEQFKTLWTLAKERNLILLEGLWTHHLPIVKEIRRLLHDERVLGDIVSVEADLSADFARAEPTPEEHEKRRALGSGTLLGVGIYPLHWLRIGFGLPATATADAAADDVARIDGVQMQLRGGTDIQTDALVNFGAGKHGVLRCSSIRRTRADAVVVYGERGYLTVASQMHRPDSFTLKLWNTSAGGFKAETEVPADVIKTIGFDSTVGYNAAVDGTGSHMNGLAYQADHFGRLLRDGKFESDVLPPAESLACLRILDAIRERGGLRYNEAVESVEQ